MKEEVNQCAATVRQTCYSLLRTLATEINKRELSLRETIALMAIGEEPGATLTYVARQAGTTLSGASKLVDGLVELGYVCRDTVEEDRRKLMLTLTLEGCRILDNISLQDTSYLSKLLSKLTPSECEMVSLTMDLLCGAFRGNRSPSNKEQLRKER